MCMHIPGLVGRPRDRAAGQRVRPRLFGFIVHARAFPYRYVLGYMVKFAADVPLLMRSVRACGRGLQPLWVRSVVNV